MNKHFFPILCVLVFVFAGCSGRSGSSSNNQQSADPSKPAMTGLNRDTLNSYSSTFTVRFEGQNSWTYQLKTRKSPTLREVSLHIEGIDKSENPGDIRLVTDGTTSWMIGAGTDQECVMFPNNQGLDPKLLYPETLIPPQDLSGLLRYTGEETVAGAANQHYSGSVATEGDWQNVQVDAWQEKSSGALMKFSMQATTNNDPIFKKGAGKITANYEAAGLGDAAIEPVQGCEIGAPLPDGAKNVVRFPGLSSFESADGAEQLKAFFQTRLPQEGWYENEPPAQDQNVEILSYIRDSQVLEIHLETVPEGGSKVKLMFLQPK